MSDDPAEDAGAPASACEDPPAEGPSCPVSGPWSLRAVQQFLASPPRDLYDSDFFDAPPDEIRIRLRVRDGKVEMVLYAVHQGRLNELVTPFDPADVFAELCG